jgi:tetratricopeptide (TPR) repeat protein
MVVSSASVALADGRAELEKARASFLARNWTDAEERLRVLLDPKTGLKERPLISQARMYLGASLLAQGRKDDAKEAFEKLVLDDPTYEPDPLSFPGDAINTFIDVRSSLLEQIKTASQNAARLAAERKAREEAEREAQRVWLEKVKEQASEEKITVRHSRIVACLPFGVGQFQNGQPLLGWIFLGTQVAALAGSGITFGMYRYAREREDESLKAQTAYYQQLSAQWHQRANDIQLVNLGFIGAFVAIAGAGVVQANVAFVSESAEKKKRDLPPLSLTTGRTTRLRAVVVADPPQAGRETFERAPSTVRAAARGQKSVSSIAPLVSALPGHDGSLAGVFVGVSGVVF